MVINSTQPNSRPQPTPTQLKLALAAIDREPLVRESMAALREELLFIDEAKTVVLSAHMHRHSRRRAS